MVLNLCELRGASDRYMRKANQLLERLKSLVAVSTERPSPKVNKWGRNKCCNSTMAYYSGSHVR